MQKTITVKTSVIFAILLFCLASISASYAGYTAHLNLFGEVDTWTPSGDCRSAGFWKTEFEHWMSGEDQHHVSYDYLLQYLDDIFVLYYNEVFGCSDMEIGTDGISFQEAYDILAVTGGTMEQKLKRQLLAAELNLISDNYQADDQLLRHFILEAEEAILLGHTSEYEYFKDVLESYNTLN